MKNKYNFKVAACYVVMNEEDYLKHSLDSIYKWADKIYVMIGIPFENDKGFAPDGTEEILKNYKDPDKKLEWWKTDEREESTYKNILLDKCREAKMDWMWIVDGDEIYDERYLPRLFNFANANRHIDAIRTSALEYWRSLKDAVGFSQHYVWFTTRQPMKIRIRMPVWIHSVVVLPQELFLFHHYGFARTPERMRLKYTSTRVRELKDRPLDLKDWLENKFIAWEKNRNVTFLHPFRSKLWLRSFSVTESTIPEIIKNHKWFNEDCIK